MLAIEPRKGRIPGAYDVTKLEGNTDCRVNADGGPMSPPLRRHQLFSPEV